MPAWPGPASASMSTWHSGCRRMRRPLQHQLHGLRLGLVRPPRAARGRGWRSPRVGASGRLPAAGRP
eukprot:3661210-Alexandrium_andersonii.AAC.1